MKIQAIDWILYICCFLLVIFGVVVIYSITYGEADTKNYAVYQIIFAGIGFLLLFCCSWVDYRFWKALAYPLYGVMLLFLAFLVFTHFGKTTLGATRWINLGFFQFQPSELYKIVSLIILAKVCDRKDLKLTNFLFALAILFIPLILILKQPDFGTALIVLLTGMVVIVTAGFNKKYLLVLGSFLVLFSTAVTLSAYSVKPFSGMLKDYQKQRIHNFINPQKDVYGTGYNVNQSVIAVGSGGLLGRGLGYGPQSQLNFIPSKFNDFIFSVAAEAFGFAGGVIMLSLMLFLILRILKIARLAKDNFGTILCYGIAAYFIFESLINIGMTMGVMPVTGIPLPLVSYGGTSLWTALIAIGICQSVMTRHKKISF